jgi:hypothetical protein
MVKRSSKDLATGHFNQEATMQNKYAGKCGCCGGRVAAGAGTVHKVNGAWVVQHQGCGRVQAKPAQRAPMQPPAGSWAATARAMAAMGGDDGFDWDAWKDEMKEREMDF